MDFIADLHTHSHYARATSKACCLEELQHWAQLKGVRIVGTGDFTHPQWFQELERKLEPAEPGLFRLRAEFARHADAEVPESCRSEVRFILSAEISSIYKRDERTRKVHSLLLVPDFAAASEINTKLAALGNIASDGRPILKLDPRDLLKITIEASADAIFIPAHIWTPWFSMLGSKSGFDSPAECFGDMERHIFAVETGLSSDPPMNWRVSSLDRYTLLSNSDLHSPRNLARNANLFRCEPDFFAIRDALRDKDPERLGGTIDLFPEEGKYHLDGHRKCGVCMVPEESLARDNLCPACGKPLVLGVLHRVMALADRDANIRPANAIDHEYIIPLPELLGELLKRGPNTKTVQRVYHALLAKHGCELRILRELPTESLGGCDAPLFQEAIRRVRERRVVRQAGFDGQYGVVHVFHPGEMDKLLQTSGISQDE